MLGGKLWRKSIKSLESHLAQNHVAWNLSHVVRNLSSVAQKKVKSPEEPYTKKIRISDCK